MSDQPETSDVTPIAIDAREAEAAEAAIRLVELQLRTSPLRQLEQKAIEAARHQSAMMRRAADAYRARHMAALTPLYAETLERAGETETPPSQEPLDQEDPLSAALRRALAAQQEQAAHDAAMQRLAAEHLAALAAAERGPRPASTVVTQRRSVLSIEGAQTGDIHTGHVVSGSLVIINLHQTINNYFHGSSPPPDEPDESA